ncbi:MAG: ATP-dependent 6-phosphofructokinase [Phycisphaerae bacterium]|nr:6-phosphofructokinase [Phycisphaerae bacterium]NIR63430.1 6-phosphofructokinase [candidate division Zixibacteria bacterium]NIP55566.1 6-phosphofructokinase [Phycisphaerae bacterium]NIS54797.1 6-phosphofructokinase [Phycisphaerae bacterium]NIU11896.1 6-phosphofructokinase [Phycisphaerae bacterium]
MKAKSIKTIAIMTGGGDCPGLNAVIRAVTKTAINKFGLEVWGIEDGYLGLIEDRMRVLSYNEVSNILTVGGTILGSSNVANPFRYQVKVGKKSRTKDVTSDCIGNLAKHNIDALICIGGDGTMASAARFAKKGVNVIGVPKTIDNDLYGTDITFGFNTAVTTATEAIDKIHTTASSHHRVMIIEVMGRYAGWIALHAGVASGSDVILLPEIPYRLDKICDFVIGRSKRGKRFSIVVVAEGAKEKDGRMVVAKKVAHSPDPIRLGGVANVLAGQINTLTGLDCRAVVLGHVQRGGTPTPFDRILATNFGHMAVEILMKGIKGHLVVLKDGKLSNIPLSRVAGKIKTVPKNNHLIKAAIAVGTSFGI